MARNYGTRGICYQLGQADSRAPRSRSGKVVPAGLTHFDQGLPILPILSILFTPFPLYPLPLFSLSSFLVPLCLGGYSPLIKGVRGMSQGDLSPHLHPAHPVYPVYIFLPSASIRVHPRLPLNLLLRFLRLFAADFRFGPAFIRGSLSPFLWPCIAAHNRLDWLSC
jgi:hypothetical protein